MAGVPTPAASALLTLAAAAGLEEAISGGRSLDRLGLDGLSLPEIRTLVKGRPVGGRACVARRSFRHWERVNLAHFVPNSATINLLLITCRVYFERDAQQLHVTYSLPRYSDKLMMAL